MRHAERSGVAHWRKWVHVTVGPTRACVGNVRIRVAVAVSWQRHCARGPLGLMDGEQASTRAGSGPWTVGMTNRRKMPARHVVVDGSNIATEGSSLPTLKQLDEAVREFLIENPDDIVTVVVDATFGHRIPAGGAASGSKQAESEADDRQPAGGSDRAGATPFC